MTFTYNSSGTSNTYGYGGGFGGFQQQQILSVHHCLICKKQHLKVAHPSNMSATQILLRGRIPPGWTIVELARGNGVHDFGGIICPQCRG